MKPSVMNPLLAVPTSEETLLDKVQSLSDAIVELKGSVADLKCLLTAKEDKFGQLLDGIGMSRLEYDSFINTEKLPPHLFQGKQANCSDAQQLKMNTDVGNKLNQLIDDLEEATAETTDFIEDQ